MMRIINEINKLNMGEAHSLIASAFNKAQEFEWGTKERVIWEEVSELATKRFAELYLKQSKKSSSSASLKFGKYEATDSFDDVEARFITIDIEVKGKSEEEVSETFEALAEKLEAVANVDIQWSTCPEVDEWKGVWTYSEGFCVEYEHGCMTEIKKELMADFKAIKKEMGIR